MPRFKKKVTKRKSFREFRKRSCRFCSDSKMSIDYKDGKALSAYLTEHGRIIPRRITGNCAYHQRAMTTAIKRARLLALIPFTSAQVKWI